MIGARSPVVAPAVRAATPLAAVVGVYLLFAGHNRPGGGFAAGLVIGAVVVLRAIAGIQRPANATVLVTAGTIVVLAVAIAPVVTGGTLLDQQVWSFEAPLLGTIKTGSALPFDIGVTAIVVGLLVALLEGLAPAFLDQPRLAGADRSTESAPPDERADR